MDPHEQYFQTLSREARLLLRVKELLYDGSWSELEADLLARKDGKPYVFRLETRIEEDLARIEELRAYEETTGVNLGEYLKRYRAKS